MISKSYVNTKDLIGKPFTIVKVNERKYRRWDSAENKFTYSMHPKREHAAFWEIELKEGAWSASAGQYSQILLAAESEGIADVEGKTFNCTSNGLSGLEIRYFFNLVVE